MFLGKCANVGVFPKYCHGNGSRVYYCELESRRLNQQGSGQSPDVSQANAVPRVWHYTSPFLRGTALVNGLLCNARLINVK